MKDIKYSFLLPSSFKIVGSVLAVLAVILIVCLKVSGAGVSLAVVRGLIAAVLLGLLLLALSREKQEDEMVVRIRYVSIMHAFVVAVFIAIVVPLVGLLMNEPIQIDYQGIILGLLVIYIVEFYWFIIRLKNEKHD